MRSVSESMTTDGTGLWSNHARSVEVTGLEVPYVNKERDFGELRVYFNTDSWDTEKHGLIYTDEGFLADLKDYLARAGYSTDVHYSEQGMQGDNYVSLDVGPQFLQSWSR